MNKERFLKLQKFILEKEKYKEKIRFYFDIHEDLKFTFFKFNYKSTSLEYDKKLDLFLSELNTPYGELIIEKISETYEELGNLLNYYKDNFNILDKGIYYFDDNTYFNNKYYYEDNKKYRFKNEKLKYKFSRYLR